MEKETQDRIRVMTGNEACAEGALAAGLKFFAGYPITPSSEIAEVLSYELPKRGGKFIQMEDEIASMGAVIGASLAGAKAMTATSGPGFSLKQENLGYASMAEVPCVVVNVMRGGPSTGLPTLPAQGDVMQSRWGTHGDHPIIVLVPNTVREVFDLTVRAFNLAERYRVPVILLFDEIIGHVSEKVVLPREDEIEVWNRVKPNVPPDQYLPYQETENDIPPFVSFGEGYRFHVTGLVHDQTGFPTNNPTQIDRMLRRLNRKIERYRDEIIEVEEDKEDGARIGIFAYGSSSRSARRAMIWARERGIKIHYLRPKVIWPFPDKEVKAMGEKLDYIIVPELNLGQIAHEVEWATRCGCEVIKINRIDGEPINPQQILDVILELNAK
ncbi:MAG: 2-oxoacid:acceptor oxidoreductase subunit alpha [candidate division KSB1 bacterium]|nr:2-oxoacid:acceptor oxidoreductase subunit alpha [candidate division KSB1 bacterium]MDZ7334530.1 2-oxoacid:acceptor oxidoreductase subunit alpha [candidate division KSB1 bacterium]MDZ7356977.1 2-oxoacid:acceptor oxidoreductase subunit alpha [candidate division KSB1 bacterium]MDZ7400961.1 2-oxoacid:acceptor oxidoreductase subunit alpha [candidate division KSB1 bacterium]